jgi:hypothetical protein
MPHVSPTPNVDGLIGSFADRSYRRTLYNSANVNDVVIGFVNSASYIITTFHDGADCDSELFEVYGILLNACIGHENGQYREATCENNQCQITGYSDAQCNAKSSIVYEDNKGVCSLGYTLTVITTDANGKPSKKLDTFIEMIQTVVAVQEK